MSMHPAGDEAVVAETVERGFDWGAAAIGAGFGIALVLLLVALALTLRSRPRTKPGREGGSW